jgi:nucleotide-binding universal stress UspA family protein
MEMSFFPRRILLAVDGSEEARLATQAATEISGTTGSEVQVVYVLPSAGELIGPHSYPADRRESLFEGAERDGARSSTSRRSASHRKAGR